MTFNKTWGEVFNYYLSKGHDHGSAAYSADCYELRAKMRGSQLPVRNNGWSNARSA